MAFIYNLTDTWNDAATTWNGIKLAVTDTASSASSNLLNLTVTGASTASFVVDKSGNLALNGSVNKITMTAPATGATLTLADNSTFITSGAFSSTFTFTGTTTLTFPTSGTVTALGNTTTGSGAIVLASSPTLITPALGTPSSGVLSGCTGYPVSALTGTGTGVLTALAVNVGSAGAFVVNGGALGTPSSGTLTNATGLPISTGVSGLGTGVATFLATPSSANLASAVTDETGSGSLVFGTSPTIGSPTITGTATFNGSTSGTVAFKAPAIAGTTTFTLPSGNGTSGYVLVTDGLGNTSWAISGGAAGNAAGVDKNVQFNDAGSMAGNAAFNFDKSTASLSLGTASVTTGKLAFYNGATANATTIQAGSASAAVTYTLPTADGTNGQALITNGSGALSWTTVTSGLAVGTTAITGGTSGRVLYDNAGTVGELAVTGTGNVVLATSPTLVTPLLGTPTSGNLSNCTNIPVNQATGTLAVANGGTGLTSGTSGGVLYYSATGTLASSAALAASSLVIGGGAGVAPSTVTTGTGVVTALGVNTGTAGAFVVNGGALGTPSSGTLTSCTGLPLSTGVTGTLPVANGGTGTSTAFTAGSVVFAGASGTYSQDNANLFWDDTNNRLGIGTASPSYNLHVRGTSGDVNFGITNTSVTSGDTATLYNNCGTTTFQITSYAQGLVYMTATASSSYIIGNYSSAPVAFITNNIERARIDASGNLLVGTTTSPTTGTQCLTIETGTAPTASPADTITIFSTDLSAGNTMLSLRTEGTPVNANTTAAATHRIAIRVNGTVYYLLANTAA